MQTRKTELTTSLWNTLLLAKQCYVASEGDRRWEESYFRISDLIEELTELDAIDDDGHAEKGLI